jgi:hypothetical protein
MELVKNIFFNTDKLVQNSTIKISYIGKFFQDNSKKVFIHYGFNENWIDSVEKEMTKSELGYQIEIDLKNYNTFNFCFKNEENKWDNNDGKNYIFNIEIPETSLITLEENGLARSNHLRRSYLWSKKLRLAVYKILVFLPKLVSGNYKRKSKKQIEN